MSARISRSAAVVVVRSSNRAALSDSASNRSGKANRNGNEALN